MCRLSVYCTRTALHTVMEFALMIVASFALTSSAGARQEVSLDGEWRFLPVESGEVTSLPAVDARWQTIRIPGMWGDGGVHDLAWFARSFAVEGWDGSKVAKISFGSVAFRTKVFLNGKQIGEHVGEWSPLELDATTTIKAGNNLLLLLVQNSKEPEDWRKGEMSYGMLHHLNQGWFGDVPASRPKWQLGIPQPVTLKILPQTYINSLFIQPLVSKALLKTDVELVNASASFQTVEVSGEVLDKGKPVLRLPPTRMTLPAGGRSTTAISQTWKGARLWWPDDPYLYRLRVYLKDESGNVIDSQGDRFGWREYRTDGIDSYLNGKPFMLRGFSWYTYMQTGEAAKGEITTLRQITRSNCFRLHCGPLPSSIIDYCDETGLALLMQSTLTAGAAEVTNPAFWPTFSKAWEEYVRANRNHPSIFGWAVGNEGGYVGGAPNVNAPSVPHLIDLVERTKVLDPTRPVTESHDFDLNGHSDYFDAVMGFGWAYYNLLPDRIRQYQSYFFDTNKMWDRKRPLMNDEWLDFHGAHSSSSLVGDLSYIISDYPDVRSYWMRYVDAQSGYLGMAEARKLRGIAGMIVLGDHTSYLELPDGSYKDAPELKEFLHKNFQELVIVPVDWFPGHDASKPFIKKFIVMNDHSYDQTVTVAWDLKVRDGKRLDHGNISLDLAAFAHQRGGVKARLPEVTGSVQADLSIRLLNKKGEELYSDTWPFTVGRKARFGDLPRCQMWEAEAHNLKIAKRLGLNVTQGDSPGGKITIVPAGSTPDRAEWENLEATVNRGGSVLVLTTNHLPERFCGVDLKLSGVPTNTVHINATDHPAFVGLHPHDVRFWAPDYRLAEDCLVRPNPGSFTVLLDTGYGEQQGGSGMVLAPMIEIVAGKGRAIITQLPLLEKAHIEPSAALILHRLLEYLSTTAKPHLPAIVEGVKIPGSMSVVRANWKELSVASISAALLDGNSARLQKILGEHAKDINEYLNAGGQVYLHNLAPANVQAVNDLWGLGLQVEDKPAGRLLLLPTDPTIRNWMWHQNGKELWPLHILPRPVYGQLLRGINHFQTCWYQDGRWGAILSKAPIIQTRLISADQRVSTLTHPGGLLEASVGKGRVVFDQVLWDAELPSSYLGTRATEYINQLLMNLGVELHSSGVSSGYIADWLVLGPIPFPERTPGKEDADYLGGEADYVAVEGKSSNNLQWFRGRLDIGADARDNMGKLMPLSDPTLGVNYAVAYLQTYVDSPTDQDATLFVTADDTAVLWVNGEKVLDVKPMVFTRDSAGNNCHLRKGTNRILVKTGDYGGGWAFLLKMQSSAKLRWHVAKNE
ncbi:MAG: hypothetical protein HY318_19230 [Armatimonadetes bacterium]|nr:hypothetical protein [Armatimonadota bacterium]